MSYSKHRRGRIFPLINAQLFPTMYNVERIPHKAYFGRVHAVALDSLKKLWIGSADPDGEVTVSSYYKR